MKHLIRGHMYQLKKDYFFFGCLALSLVFLMVTIRFSSIGAALTDTAAVDSLLNTFLSGDFVLYAFMLLTANMVAEAYLSGAIKNIIGRGISKKKYYLSIVFTISAAYLLAMLFCGVVTGVLAYSRFGMGTVLYPAYYALAVIARIVFVTAHISFAMTMTILTRNAISGLLFGLAIPNVPQLLEMSLRFMKLDVDLSFFKLSTHMPSIYSASNDLSTFLPCFAVLGCYLIVSVAVGFGFLMRQDVK